MWIYEWGHKALPALPECRPIYVGRAVAMSGFEIVKTRSITIIGLSVEIVLARKPHSIIAVGQAERVSKAETQPSPP